MFSIRFFSSPFNAFLHFISVISPVLIWGFLAYFVCYVLIDYWKYLAMKVVMFSVYLINLEIEVINILSPIIIDVLNIIVTVIWNNLVPFSGFILFIIAKEITSRYE